MQYHPILHGLAIGKYCIHWIIKQLTEFLAFHLFNSSSHYRHKPRHVMQRIKLNQHVAIVLHHANVHDVMQHIAVCQHCEPDLSHTDLKMIRDRRKLE